MPISLKDIVILNIHGDDCGCIISRISKRKALNVFQSADYKLKVFGLYKKIDKKLCLLELKLKNTNFIRIKSQFEYMM